MAAAETARLIAELTLKDKLSPGVKSATGSIGKLETSLGKIGASAKRGAATAGKALLGLGAVAAVGIGAAVRSGLENLATLESAVSAVDGSIKQVGLTGKVTGAQVAAWANEIEGSVQAAFDDKDITSATANLLRYGKVSEANLRPAMVVMTDLAAKTGSVESASELLGKALADPVKATGKLSRYGIILTKTEIAQIKAFDKAGKKTEAQALLLDILSKSTTGAADALNGPYKDSMNTFSDVTEDAQKALATGFLPVIQRVADWLSKSLADPKVMADIRGLGDTLANVFDQGVSFVQKIPWGTVRDAMGVVATAAKGVLDAFTSLPGWVQTAVVSGWGLNKISGGALGDIVGELGKGLIKGVLGMTAGVVNLKAATVVGGGVGAAGGAPGVVGAAGKGAGLLSKVGSIVGAVTIVGLAAGVAEELRVPLGFGIENGPKLPTDDLAWPWGPRNTPDLNLGPLQHLLGGDSTLPKNGPGRQEGAFRDSDRIAAALADTHSEQLATTRAVDTVRAETAASIVAFRDGERTSASGLSDVRSATLSGTSGMTSAQNTGTSRIVSAIASNRPITNVVVNVTASNVTKSVSTSSRNGAGNGSKGGGRGGGQRLPG